MCVSVRGVKPPFASVNSKEPTTKTNEINLLKKQKHWWGLFCEQERRGVVYEIKIQAKRDIIFSSLLLIAANEGLL